jgi:hypothetical protein
VLRAAFGKRVIRIPRSNKTGEYRCDFAIWHPDCIVLVEAKGEHYVARDHHAYMSVDERRQELIDVGLRKAVDQLAQMITALWQGDVTLDDLPTPDWTVAPIVPVVVTEERMPHAPGLWERLYQPIARPLHDLPRRGLVGELRVISIHEIEHLPDLATAHGPELLLYQWGASADTRELPWSWYLNSRGIAHSGAFIKLRFLEAMRYLARRLGLDPGKIGPTEEQQIGT